MPMFDTPIKPEDMPDHVAALIRQGDTATAIDALWRGGLNSLTGAQKSVQNYVAHALANGAKVMFIASDLSQLRANYGDGAAETILANCSTKIAFGQNDQAVDAHHHRDRSARIRSAGAQVARLSSKS
jgi:hypothetical protein